MTGCSGSHPIPTDCPSKVARLEASLGKSLAKNKGLKSLTIVGTSAGSFAADACCSAYVASAGSDKKQRAAVRLTLADPFAAKEGTSFQAGRGAQYFGRDADFAEHILNTDDIVPNTEVPLPLCYCLDVTGAKERKSFPPPDKTGDLVYDFIVGSLGGPLVADGLSGAALRDEARGERPVVAAEP